MKSPVVLVLLFLYSPLFVYGAEFSRTLSLGMRGDDVRALQIFLNGDPLTRISEAGAGSPGKETNYFGVSTKRALIKFQEKYRDEVLVPAGLSGGTGIMGPRTRQKINERKNSVITTNVISTEDTTPPQVEKGEVIVMFPSQYEGKPRSRILISGMGFTPKDNTVYFGNEHSVAGLSSWNGQSIVLSVPEIPKGAYSLSVKNARGESKYPSFFIVTDGVTAGPKIESVSPETVSEGDTVIIEGSGFLPSGNTLLVGGVGVFKNIISENRTTISFTVPKNLFNATSTPKIRNFDMTLFVYIVNDNGVSNVKTFLLKI